MRQEIYLGAALVALLVGCDGQVTAGPDVPLGLDAPAADREAPGVDVGADAGDLAAGQDGQDGSVPGEDSGRPEPARTRNTDFAEADAEVTNPDRGFYFWDDHDVPLVLVKQQLGPYCDTAELPATLFDELAARLVGHRQAGRRAILRFLYADDGELNGCGLADARSIDLVLGHIPQLAAVLEEHADVIAHVEAGFLGMWGEWNSELAPDGTSLVADLDHRRSVLDALRLAVPTVRNVLVRRPRFRDEQGAVERIGFHNDCFLASATDFGTYDGERSIEEWKDYVRAATTTVPIGGETCSDVVEFTACDAAVAEMERLRFAYLHEGYHLDVIVRWKREGCLEQIRRRLGYRMVLRGVQMPTRVAGGDVLRVGLELENLGFAPPYSQRRLQLVLRQGDSVRVLEPGTSERSDTRAWLPGPPFAVELVSQVPGDLAPGTWELRLVLLEDLSDDPRYALLLANDERVRDDVLRENRLGTIEVR